MTWLLFFSIIRRFNFHQNLSLSWIITNQHELQKKILDTFVKQMYKTFKMLFLYLNEGGNGNRKYKLMSCLNVNFQKCGLKRTLNNLRIIIK